MKKEDKKTILIFIILIILIIGVLLFNIYKNKSNNVDRKVEYIFNNLTYDMVYNKGADLFLEAVSLLKDNVFEYEKNNNENIQYYSINDYNNYKKIKNSYKMTNILSNNALEKYMELKKIIKNENDYYIEDYKNNIDTNYIGSIIEIDKYNDNYVYFKSINYYCDNTKYIGILDSIPKCSYTSNESILTIINENNNLKINNIEEIQNILK